MHSISLKNQGPRASFIAVDGSDVLVLENEFLKVSVLAGRGATVYELQYKPLGLDVLFKSPAGVGQIPAPIQTNNAEHAAVDHHPHGWFSCFPNGAGATKINGASLGFHGEAWGLPFALKSINETADSAEATLVANCVRTPFRIEKKFSLKKDVPTLVLEETVTNTSSVEFVALWGQHPTLGAPFIDEHCRIELDATGYFNHFDEPMMRLRWPMLADGTDLSVVRGAQTNSGKMVYVTDFTEAKVRVVSPTWKLAYELKWNADIFPYCWLWENAGQTSAPWWGRSHALALEPFTGLKDAIEEGHGVIRLAGGASETGKFEASLLPL